ncbi:MAG: hypothetical protein ACRD2D_05325 [Terriglobales bacterium]
MSKRLLLCILALSCLGLIQSSVATGLSKGKTKDYVYVCSCLHGQSCACMTEAKHEGPCACGVDGGPPMLRVEAQSNWAKANRTALAGGAK